MSTLPLREDIVYFSTKTWEHVASVAFRQHVADSHCRFIHGYALTITAVFGANELDVRNWVVDFGALKTFKGWLEKNFDHKFTVAQDDPALDELRALENIRHVGQAAEVRIVEATGCEAFARLCFEWLETWLTDNGYTPRCWVESVEVSEHTGNSAIVKLRPHDPMRDIKRGILK
jgi:6-pyruvoyltetrahydropterin/6-carboxytetrahydropterin synthase